MQFLSRVRDKLGKGRPAFTYGILKPCRRCVYGRSQEPILVFSRVRGPRIIVNLGGNTYVRQGGCLGYKECGKCFEAVENNKDLPCKWNKF